MPNRELELKLELPASDFQRLRKSPQLGASTSKDRKTLKSIYFDSPDHRLHDEGIALRLRNGKGKGWLQTVKADASLKGGLSDVTQVEAQLDKCEPDLGSIGDKPLKRRIEKILEGTELHPVIETVVDRTTHIVKKDGCTAELAFDKGRVEANAKTAELREVELELLSGSYGDFLSLARELFADVSIRPSLLNKAERGYRLLTQKAVDLQPVHAREIKLHRNETTREAFATILRSAADQIVTNQRVIVESGHVEAVHQMRVGLTRLRAALKSFRPYTGASWLGELESDAQSVARAVGHLRDADVLIAEIYNPVAEEASGVPGFPGLLEALKAHREAAYREVLDKLSKGIWPRLLLTLALGPYLIETGGKFGEPVKTAAGEIMERRWKRVRKYGERLDSLDLEERHSMRKALKRLRYNCEFFKALYGSGEKSFITRLKEMQDLFGAINDARMAEKLIGIAIEKQGDDPAPLAAAGYAVGLHEAKVSHIWSKAQREWKRLEKASGFWR